MIVLECKESRGPDVLTLNKWINCKTDVEVNLI